MLVVVFISLAAQLACARPTPILTARQTVVTNANGITQTVQETSGSSSGLTIGATVAVIVGFVALILVGIWLGSWKRKRDQAMQKVMVEAHQEAKNAHRLTMAAGQSHGPSSSVSSLSKIYGKGSTASIAASSTSSFGSAGVLPSADYATSPNGGNAVLHHPSPRTPSILVQTSFIEQHSEHPPSPATSSPSSNDGSPQPRRSRSIPPPSPETLQNRTSYYTQQPARPSPLSNSVILSEPQSPSYETTTHERPVARPAPVRRKSSAADLIITVPPVLEEEEESPRLPPPGLENGGHISPRSPRSEEMGTAL